jgi:hypothetical protein
MYRPRTKKEIDWDDVDDTVLNAREALKNDTRKPL